MLTYEEAVIKTGEHFLERSNIVVAETDTVTVELDNMTEGCCEACWTTTPVFYITKRNRRGREVHVEISWFDDFMRTFHTIITES